MDSAAASRASRDAIRWFVASAQSPLERNRDSKRKLATCCASNRPAEAVTASRAEVQPIAVWPPEPVKRPLMHQTWRRLTFLHWPYEAAVVRRLLPPEVELDTFDGSAWVSLAPFEIHNIGWFPAFHETNVRTYVIGPDGSRAVWFFSLDAARLAAVIGARIAYRLPYFWAKMGVASESGTIHYVSRRRHPHSASVMSDIVVKPGGLFTAQELRDRDHFLTARYRLYTLLYGRLGWAQIEHAAWPLAKATVVTLDQNLIEAAG